jgi:hypothetical protein
MLVTRGLPVLGAADSYQRVRSSSLRRPTKNLTKITRFCSNLTVCLCDVLSCRRNVGRQKEYHAVFAAIFRSPLMAEHVDAISFRCKARLRDHGDDDTSFSRAKTRCQTRKIMSLVTAITPMVNWRLVSPLAALSWSDRTCRLLRVSNFPRQKSRSPVPLRDRWTKGRRLRSSRLKPPKERSVVEDWQRPPAARRSSTVGMWLSLGECLNGIQLPF